MKQFWSVPEVDGLICNIFYEKCHDKESSNFN